MTKEERQEIGDKIDLYDKLMEKISPQLKAIDIIKQEIINKDFDTDCEHPAIRLPSIRLNVNASQYNITFWAKHDSADVKLEGGTTSDLLKEISAVILKFLEEKTAKLTEQIQNI